MKSESAYLYYIIVGNYREINGRDAELTCEFPRGSHLISNIVWERVGDKDHYNRGVATSSSLRDYLGRRMQVRQEKVIMVIVNTVSRLKE